MPGDDSTQIHRELKASVDQHEVALAELRNEYRHLLSKLDTVADELRVATSSLTNFTIEHARSGASMTAEMGSLDRRVSALENSKKDEGQINRGFWLNVAATIIGLGIQGLALIIVVVIMLATQNGIQVAP